MPPTARSSGKIPPRGRERKPGPSPPRPSGRRGSVPKPEAGPWNLEIGHGWGLEQPTAGLGDPARPHGRAIDPRTVGGDPRIGIHLPVELGDQHEREPPAQRHDSPRTNPDRGQRIEAVPYLLRAA